MKRILTVLCALAALAGCTPEGSAALRAGMAAQLEAWNAAGVDPVQMDQRSLMYASTACGSLTAVSTVWNPEAPEMSEGVAAWCGLVTQALAPAQN